jgi:hypothetical protein
MKCLYASVATAALVIGAPAVAQTTAAPSSSNTIFLVDESGSMGGEHDFLENFVPDVDSALAVAGFTQRNFGLLGFAGPGTGPANLREFTIGGAQVGSASDFVTAAENLVTTGSTEDGYAAIDAALASYNVNGATTFVLVTDEDRDDTDSSLTFETIRDALNAAGANLAAILNVTIENTDGDTAISTDGVNALTQDGATFTSVPHDGFTGGNGDTIADYADLALATNGGCVADLNQLRAGGDAAAAFGAAFETCVINAATNAGIVAILEVPVRDATMTVAQDIRHKLRLLAQSMSGNGGGSGAPTLSTRGQVIDQMFGVDGLRGYANVTGSFGSVNGGDLDSRGVTAGADYTLDAAGGTARIGGALSFVDGNVEDGSTRISTDTTQASIYGIYRMSSGLQFSSDLQIGQTDSDTSRQSGGALVTGEAETDYRAISVEAGQRFELGGGSGVIMPYGGLRQERIEQDSYTESNGGVVPGYEQDLSTAVVGLRYEADVASSFGDFETIVDASFNRVFSQDLSVGTGTVNIDPGDVDENRLDLGVSFAVDMGLGSQLSVNLSGSKSENVSTASVGLGVQMSF